MKIKVYISLLLIFMLMPMAVDAQIKMGKSIIAGGGGKTSSANFGIGGTAGQPAAGDASSATFGCAGGYYPTQGGAGPVYVCGDANGDGMVNVGDAVFLISYVFKGGLAPDPLEAGDANCDGGVNVGDAVYLISYVFKGGPEPCCP